MKFYHADGMIAWGWFFIIPTININTSEIRYGCENIAIELHWLCFHFRAVWIEKGFGEFRKEGRK